MSATFKFGGGKWAVKDGYALAYNDVNNNFKPLPFDFTRASSATRVNREGLIEVVGQNKPRIDFLNNTSGHLLLEPSRTNSFPESNDFSTWSSNRLDLTSDNLISPDGSQNADKVAQQSGFTSAPNINYTGWTAGTYTISIFAKKGTWNYLATSFNGVSYFNLNTGTIDTENANHSASIENYGNGWYRCMITATISTTTTAAFYFAEFNNTLTTTDTQGYMYIYGAQIETGSYATSYIPTENNPSGVTRVAENTTTQDNVPSTVIGQTEGTVYAEFKIYETPTGTQRIIILSDGTGNERIGIAVGSGILYGFIVDGGTTQCEIVKSSFTGGTHKVAFGYKANDFVLYLNGVQVGTDNSGSVSSCNRIDLGNQFNASQLEGNIIDAKLYNTRLTDTELQNLTS